MGHDRDIVAGVAQADAQCDHRQRVAPGTQGQERETHGPILLAAAQPGRAISASNASTARATPSSCAICRPIVLARSCSVASAVAARIAAATPPSVSRRTLRGLGATPDEYSRCAQNG